MDSIIKKKYMFLFDDLSIDEYRLICAEKAEKERLLKIKTEKAKLRRAKRRWKLREMAKQMDDEIREYLMKVSPPRNDFERMLLDKMKKELGTITSAKELSLFLKVSLYPIYQAIEAGEILTVRRGTRIFIITEGLLPFLR